MPANLSIELTLRDDLGAGIAGRFPPGDTGSRAFKSGAFAELANLLAAVVSGSKPGKMRVRVDEVVGASASASFTVTGANIAAGETIEIDIPGLRRFVLTCVASGAVAGDGTFDASGTDATVATNIRAAINSLPKLRDLVSAGGSTNTVALTAIPKGTAPNGWRVVDGTTNGTSMSGSLAFSSGVDPSGRVTAAIAITHANVSNGDTVTVGGVTFTWLASPSTESEVLIGADASADATNLAAKITAHSSLAGIVTASAASGTVTITYLCDPRVALLVRLATSDATAMGLTQPSLASRTATNSMSTRTYAAGAP